MTKIFISYRREDSADATGRIADWLRDKIGEEHIFTDVDNIPLGVDFRTHIDNGVSQCDVFLVVIGNEWISSKNSDDELRLNDPTDFVRIEIESALNRDIPVIPLLVRGASAPQGNQLPDSIANLAYRNAQKIRPDPDFKNDANRLYQSIIKHFEPDTTEQAKTAPVTTECADESRLTTGRWQRTLLWLGAIAIIAGVATVLYLNILRIVPIPDGLTTNTNFTFPEMVEIPAGSFMMGSGKGSNSERPVHEVTVPAFEIARNELTWADWHLCEYAGGCTKISRPSFFDQIDGSEQSRHPVVNISIENISDYLIWINTESGDTYRLPSEAEWEYAARAGSTNQYYWGDTIGKKRANCNGCGSQWDGHSTAPVGEFEANQFGLNDVHGNVWEWVADCWHENYEGAPANGSAWMNNCTSSDSHLIRGGSWNSVPKRLRAAVRGSWGGTVGADIIVGFRLARTLP